MDCSLCRIRTTEVMELETEPLQDLEHAVTPPPFKHPIPGACL